MRIRTLQRHRINRVINFTRENASQRISLNDLADVACISRFHFARVFADYCHETPMEFVSRVRLEQSISRLIYQPHRPVTDIALTSGFASSQSFANAFRHRFKVSPRKVRAQNSWYVTDFPENQYFTSPVMSGLLMQMPDYSHNRAVEMQAMPEMRLAYLRHRGPYYNRSMGRKAQLIKLIDWAKPRGLWCEETSIIGVCPDNSAVTPPQFCQYDFGIEVEDGVREDELISIQKLPAATLATLRVAGTSSTARQAWRWLISQWLPRSGMILAAHSFFEIGRWCDGCPDDPSSEALLCMPVCPRWC